MSDNPLIEERYAPDQAVPGSGNMHLPEQTKAVQAEGLLGAFLEEYSSPERLRSADPKDVQQRYFKHLGFYRRAGWLVEMADQLLRDHPRPDILRRKDYRHTGYACEVAHLTGVGEYGSDAWRLFCKKPFYAGHRLMLQTNGGLWSPRTRTWGDTWREKGAKSKSDCSPATSPLEWQLCRCRALQHLAQG
ncbi:hypothetical protein LTR22_026827 [Elasticomyces elasticus]|nr:hypothetical protein LTR22_026827 [Elasticomyces elasticus]